MNGDRHLRLPTGPLRLPAFLPDGTSGVVRGIDADDLRGAGTPGLMMNVFHLMQRPGQTTIKALGGLHRMAGWDRPIVTDSGGFQAFSLLRDQPKRGSVTDRGLTVRPEGRDRDFKLGPEKSVRLQLQFGADVVTCLDDCTHVDEAPEAQESSVERTIRWARAGRREFDRHVDPDDPQRPLLMAVVQGGGDLDLRRRCAESLLEIGFDAYGYGGWPLKEGALLRDVLAYTRELIPPEFPMHALGVGHPPSVAEVAAMGYDLADSSLPTRDARRGRLYRFADGEPKSFEHLYIGDDRHRKVDEPIEEGCDCHTCRTATRGYLHHLFAIRDALGPRLATIHNLRLMSRLMARL